jgi:hypothetical protein
MSAVLAPLASARKAIAAGLGAVLSAVLLTEKVSFLLPPHAQAVLGVLTVVLTPVVTWLVPNKAA